MEPTANTPAPLEKQRQAIIQTLPKSSQIFVLLNEHKKIRLYGEKDFVELARTLLGLSKFIGITDPPEPEIIKQLMAFLSENFGDFSKEEINKAFSLALAHKLGIDDIKPYNKLTPQYLSTVLVAYRSHRGKELIAMKQKLEKKPEEMSEEERDNIVARNVLICFDDYQDDKELTDYGNAVYNWLDRKGILNLDSSAKKKIMERASGELIERLQANKTSNPKSAGEYGKLILGVKAGTEQEMVRSQAKLIALREYFDSLIEMGIDVKEHVKQYLVN